MKHFFLAIFLVFSCLFWFFKSPALVNAAEGSCSPGSCPAGQICDGIRGCIDPAQRPNNPAAAAGVFGQVEPPPGLDRYDAGASGLIQFISVLIKVASIVAGIWSMINFIIAGYIYLTVTEASSHAKVRDKLTLTIIGLLLIVGSYTLAGVVGLIIFGDASYILSPTLTGPTF